MKVPSVLYSAVITTFLVQSGFSMGQIGTIWSVTLYAETVLDFPTGGLADKFGRLKIFMIGMVLMGTARILYAVNGGAILVVYLGAFVMGAGESQVSGTMSPWFISALSEKDNSYVKRVFAKDHMISNIAGIVSGFLIACLPLHYAQILCIAGIVQIVGGLAIYIAVPDNFGSGNTVKENITGSLKYYVHDKKVIACTVLITMLYSFYSIYLFVWQPIGSKFGVSDSRTGLVNSIYLISLAVGSYVVHKNDFSKIQNMLVILFLGIALIDIILSQNIVVYLIGIFLYGFTYGAISPCIMSLVQFCILDKYRSSLTSLVSWLSFL